MFVMKTFYLFDRLTAQEQGIKSAAAFLSNSTRFSNGYCGASGKHGNGTSLKHNRD